jgi:hypothetical protein
VLHLEGIQPKTKYDLDVSQKGEGEGEGVTVLRCYGVTYVFLFPLYVARRAEHVRRR